MLSRSLLVRVIFYFNRELNPIRASFSTLFDSIVLFPLSIISHVFRKTPYILSRYTKLVESRRAKLVQNLFQVDYLLYDVFPPDTYWNDYFRREDFLPKKDDIIIDIGATIGDYSLIAAKLGAKVIAIEPSPKSFPILLKNIKLNKMEDKINPIKCALSSKEDTLIVSIDETSGYVHPSTLKKEIKVPQKL